MSKAKKRTIATIFMMSLLAIFILWFYFYWTNRTDPLNTSNDEQTDVEKIISKDLEQNYPETPREVVKLFGEMNKVLYSDLEDEEIEIVALKIRELYDKEFLDANPEEEYINKLYTDLAIWKDKNRSITNYRLLDKENDEYKLDNKNHSIVYIAYTVQQNSKYAIMYKVLLRQDETNKWRILGWEVLSNEEQKLKKEE
jgi:hypothetical protein